MNSSKKIVYVRGNLIYTSRKFRYGPGSGGLFDESYSSKADEIIEGDLIIGPSSDNQGSIYTTYWAKYGFSCTECWDEFIPISMEHVKSVFDDEIESLKDLLLITDARVNSHTFFRMILVDVFSALDYYLSQVLLCKYAQDEDAFQGYCRIVFKGSEDRIENLKEEVFRDKIRKEIFSSKTELLNEIFQKTLGEDYPRYTNEMEEYIRLRHLCVHRLGITKSGDKINIDKDIVDKVIKEVSEHVDKINTVLTIADLVQ